jgi:hypothetical protein
MRTPAWSIAAAAIGGLWLVGISLAQGQQQNGEPPVCQKTRAEVRAECTEFLRKHRWDEISNNWILKSGERPPEGVAPREQIRAERDSFLKGNRWNEIENRWDPVGSAPRDLARRSRSEVRKETAAFMRTHRWDDESGRYIERRVN